MQIRQLGPRDTESLWGVVDADAKWLEQQGMTHWADYYTSEKIESKFIEGDVVFGLEVDGKLVGTITLSQTSPPYYEPIDFECFTKSSLPAYYITTLAVDPEHHGKGYAKKLMNHAEEFVRKSGGGFIRFDVRAMYEKLVQFYQKLDYKIVGGMIDPTDNDQPYHFFEKEIS